MALPVRSLPVIQRWDCHSCSDCCRTYHVRVTPTEKERILSQGWDEATELGGRPPVVWDASLGSDRLNHTADGACVFLGDDHRCRIHARFGAAAKPLACRLYPFVLVPAGDHWRVGIRFACPSAAENLGKPVPEHEPDLADYARLLEAETPTALRSLPPPPLQPGLTLPWSDLLRVADTIDDLLADPRIPFEQRIRRVLTFSKLAQPVRPQVLAGGIRPVLQVLAAAAIDETPDQPDSLPPPGWVGRMLFRQAAAIYIRKDHGPNAGIARHSKWTRIHAAWRFALGRGTVPRLHAKIPATTFAAAEHPHPPLEPAIHPLLSRYFRVKILSLQFCGRANFGLPFWDGLASLLLTYPLLMWLYRLLAANASDNPQSRMILALRIIDDNFGYNPLLGTARQSWAVRILRDRGELDRLSAWYSREIPDTTQASQKDSPAAASSESAR